MISSCGNKKGNINIFHISSSSVWWSPKKSVWWFPLPQNILFSGTSSWWSTWDTEPRARETCRSPQIQKADQICSVQWITLSVTFMHKRTEGKPQNFPKTLWCTDRNSACAKRVNSMLKLLTVVDLPSCTWINRTVKYLMI